MEDETDETVREKGKSAFPQMIADGIDINVADRFGNTALMQFVNEVFRIWQSGDLDRVHALIEAGANVNVANNEGDTALMLSSFLTGHYPAEVVQALINAGADVNVTNKQGNNALMIAGQFANVKSVRALIDAGVDVNAINNQGYTALMFGTKEGDAEIVRALVEAGANVNAINNQSYTVLMFGAISNNVEIVHTLVSAGANVDASDKNGLNSLMLATRNGKTDAARALIENGASVNATCNSFKTALFYFPTYIDHNVQEDQRVELLRILIDAGINVNATDQDGRTALFLHVRNCWKEVCSFLIKEGKAMVNAKDVYGRTPIFYAILGREYAMPRTPFVKITEWSRNETLDTARLLVENGACINDTDELNVSVLQFCIDYLIDNRLTRDIRPVVEFFSENGIQRQTIVDSILNVLVCRLTSDYAKAANDGQFLDICTNALTVAKSFTDDDKLKKNIENVIKLISTSSPEKLPEILNLLIQSGADPNTADSKGNTALHYCTILPFMGVKLSTIMDVLGKLKQNGVKFANRNYNKETAILFCLSRVRYSLAERKGISLETGTVASICQLLQLLLEGNMSACRETNLIGESVFHLILEIFQDAFNLKDVPMRKLALEDAVKLLKLFSLKFVGKGTVNKTDIHLNCPLHLWASLSLPSGEYAENVTKDAKFEELLEVILKHLLSCGAKQLNARNEKASASL